MINDDEVDRTGGPRINKTYYLFGQTFPLWGKRDLQHQAALHALEAVRGQERSTRDELDERIKVAFAQYYAVSRGIAINADIARLARQMTRAAIARYSQAEGSQAAAILAGAEETRAATEAVRLEGDRRAAIARINALLARPAEAPLSTPQALRPIPAVLPPIAAMVERAKAGNPQLWSLQAEISRPTRSASWRAKPGIPMSRSPPARSSAPTGRPVSPPRCRSLYPPATGAEERRRAGGRCQFRCGAAAAGCHYGADRR